MVGLELYVPSPRVVPKQLTQTDFIPNGTLVVSGSKEGYLLVWDISLIMVLIYILFIILLLLGRVFIT